jgi:hypothetical protein
MLTFKDLQARTLRYLDEATATGTTTLALVKDFLNQANEARCTQERWPFMLWDGSTSLTLTKGTVDYILHPEVHRLLYLYNRTRNEYLSEISMRGLERLDPNITDAGAPTRYAIWGKSPVAAPLPSAQMVKIVSSSASDTGATYTVQLRGIASGTTSAVNIAMSPTGTTAVTSGTALSQILSVGWATPWNGELTMTANTTGETLLYVKTGCTLPTYPIVHLLDKPNSADTLEYRFFRQPYTMVNDGDVPDIPPPHSEILVWDALLMFSGYQSDMSAKAVQVWVDMRDRLEKAMYHNLLEGHTIGAQARFIRQLGGETTSIFPHVYMSN